MKWMELLLLLIKWGTFVLASWNVARLILCRSCRLPGKCHAIRVGNQKVTQEKSCWHLTLIAAVNLYYVNVSMFQKSFWNFAALIPWRNNKTSALHTHYNDVALYRICLHIQDRREQSHVFLGTRYTECHVTWSLWSLLQHPQSLQKCPQSFRRPLSSIFSFLTKKKLDFSRALEGSLW